MAGGCGRRRGKTVGLFFDSLCLSARRTERTIVSDLTVFVVDDDEAIRDSLGAVLEAAGLDVETFSSGDAFLAAFDDMPPGCLLADLRMPGLSGLELHEALRSEERSVGTECGRTCQLRWAPDI